ncbi:SusC/RagA family TonB-linked outer membrane protein [Pedobacter sp. GR22-6]|uniref:SusC/RagA family TonB-linked outer membrane protein n=1 Tax=Pedobacter sp. GR22-6 TaxID=3127957 RepID=UPI00307F5301
MYKIYTKNLGECLRHALFPTGFVRITTVLIVVLLSCLSTKLAAQKLDYINNRISIAQLFKEIKKQTGYRVTWNEAKLDGDKLIAANFKDSPIPEVMRVVLSGTELEYSIVNKTIVIKDKLAQKRLANPSKQIEISGRVLDTAGVPLSGANVTIDNTSFGTVTDEQGNFRLMSDVSEGVLMVKYVGYESTSIIFNPGNLGPFTITLKAGFDLLSEVAIVSTGYQEIPKERTTGSFTVIDNKLLNRTVSPDLISRLKGVTNGLLLDNSTGNSTRLSIRGRSTIFSNTTPLIVVDNFPFEGDLNAINPDNIENITILKDAAAASIWGVRAGNGVIVITTKRGLLNAKALVSVKTDVTIGEKPDLYHQPQLNSSDYIDIEKFLFERGAFNSTINNGYATISPVVALLQKLKQDPSLASQVNGEIEVFRKLDYREQRSRYFIRRSLQQHYSTDIAGGGKNQSYYFSVGLDKNRPNAVAQSDSRITLKGANTYKFLNDRINLTTDLNFSKSKSDNAFTYNRTGYLPYEQVADENGNALPIVINSGLRSSYTDTAGRGALLDWKYRPLDELKYGTSNQEQDLTDYRLNLGISYRIIKGLTFGLNYQFYSANTKAENTYGKDSFYTRNLINSFSKVNSNTGVATLPIPTGDIYTPTFTARRSNYGRAQLNFNSTWNPKHSTTAIAGYEVRDDSFSNNSYTLYGYNAETATNIAVDYVTQFRNYYNTGLSRIPSGMVQSATKNRYLSFYANATYIYDEKYTITGSYRRDESNLFGVKANQKGVPLWSLGLAWNLQKENFLTADWLSALQIKASYGYNGNVNNSISAYLTAVPSFTNQFTNSLYYTIVNPPNESLRWERVKNINLGLYFALKENRISGSVEYYVKDGLDLIATSPIAPQTGISTFTGNTANTHTAGIDLQLNTKNINRSLRWETNFILNFVKDKITEYKASIGNNGSIVSSSTNSLSPLEQYPINSIFAYRWAGLDANGNPQGYLDNLVSLDYTKIRGSQDRNQLDYFGSATPTSFGAVRNTFQFKNFELSFNVTYKMGYYFKRLSVNYSNLYVAGGSFIQPDYEQRWQNPGDELKTNVPSAVYPNNSSRSAFYTDAAILVSKGNHIRLQDINFNYSLQKSQLGKLPFTSLNIYSYITNIGLLWRANEHGIDPDQRSGYLTPTSFAIGLKASF